MKKIILLILLLICTLSYGQENRGIAVDSALRRGDRSMDSNTVNSRLATKIDTATAHATIVDKITYELFVESMYNSFNTIRTLIANSNIMPQTPVLASNNTTTAINLSATVLGIYDSVQVFRSNDNIVFTQIASLPYGITTYTDPQSAHVTRYYYFKTKFGGIISAASNIVEDFVTKNWYASNVGVGNLSGDSWANARLLSSFGWASRPVRPGDTVYVNGGPANDSLVYVMTQQCEIPDNIDGTEKNPIVITRGKDPGYNGVPILTRTGAGTAPFTVIYNIGDNDYFELSYLKFRGGGYADSTALVNLATSINSYPQLLAIQAGKGWYVHHNDFDVATLNTGISLHGSGTRIEYNRLYTYHDTRLATDLIHIEGDDGGPDNKAGDLTIAYNWMYNSNRQTGRPNLGHRDFIQSAFFANSLPGDTTRIHDNVFIDPVNSTQGYQTIYASEAAGHYEVFNNIIMAKTLVGGQYISFNNATGVFDLVLRAYSNTIYTDATDGRCVFWGLDTLYWKNNIVHSPNNAQIMYMDGMLKDSGYWEMDYNQYFNSNVTAFAYMFENVNDGHPAETFSYDQWKTYFGQETHSEFVTTTFVNPGGFTAADYKLASNSQGIDEGTPLPAQFNKDYEGITRPLGSVWDRGAFEFSGDNWYISNVASGTGTADSWANADDLPTFDWSKVTAGDTMFLDGGTDSISYTTVVGSVAILYVGGSWSGIFSGLPNRPIVITRGKETGHNGIPIIDGSAGVATVTLSNAAVREYIEISDLKIKYNLDGTGGGGFFIRQGSTASVNNIHLYRNTIETLQGNGIYISAVDSMKIKWNTIRIHGAENPSENDGIHLEGSASVNYSDYEIAYNDIRVTRLNTDNSCHSDAIQTNNFQSQSIGKSSVHHNRLVMSPPVYSYNWGGSCLNLESGGGSWDVYNNVLVFRNLHEGNAIVFAAKNWSTPNSDANLYGKIVNNTIYTTNHANTQPAALYGCDSIIYKNNVLVKSGGGTVSQYGIMIGGDTELGYCDIDYNGAMTGDISDFCYLAPDDGTIRSTSSQLSWTEWKAWTTLGSNNKAPDANGVWGNISFVDSSGLTADAFRLNNESEGIDDGADLSSLGLLFDDYNGTTRPVGIRWDIGAFERAP